MNSFSALFEQIRLYLNQNISPDVITEAVPIAIVGLCVGVGLCVLGAKLSRFGITGAFVLLGAWLGYGLSGKVGFAPPLCAAVGAMLVGSVGYLLYRVWVGAITGVVLASLAMGGFGYQRVLPHMEEYEQIAGTPDWTMIQAQTVTSLASGEPTTIEGEYAAQQWAEDFWTFVNTKDVNIERTAKAIGAVALLVGLLFGLALVRSGMIFSTAVLGTAFVASSAGTIVTHYVPETYQTLANSPGVAGTALAGFFLTSVVLQALVTRQGPNTGTEKNRKS